MKNKILILAGDGVGPEIIGEARKVLDFLNEKYQLSLTITEALVGGAAYDKTGTPLPEATLTADWRSRGTCRLVCSASAQIRHEFARRDRSGNEPPEGGISPVRVGQSIVGAVPETVPIATELRPIPANHSQLMRVPEGVVL